MTPTSTENLVKINNMFDAVSNQISMIYYRWQEEKEFEDFDEYISLVKNIMPDGFVVTGGSQKPFGFKFNIGTEAEYFLKAKAKSVSWERIK